MCLCYLFGAKNCMTTSESKDRFFYKTNRFESIRLTNRIEWIRIANWNALLDMPWTVQLYVAADHKTYRPVNRPGRPPILTH